MVMKRKERLAVDRGFVIGLAGYLRCLDLSIVRSLRSYTRFWKIQGFSFSQATVRSTPC